MLWVVPNCDPCAQGRALLANRGVPFSERDAQANIETQQALKKVNGDLNVPLLEVGEARVRGFDESNWNAALDSAGYPKERAYGQPPTQPVIANIPAAPKAPAKEAAAATPQ
jgi:glutaredoxin